MKYVTGLMLVAILAACGLARTTKPSHNDVEGDFGKLATYKVYKIDSINNYFLIYARRKDSLYKIVSKRENISKGNKIYKGRSYPFILHSTLSNKTMGNKKLPGRSPLVNCFYYDDSTKICLEGKLIRDLYYADNIKGLLFVTDGHPARPSL